MIRLQFVFAFLAVALLPASSTAQTDQTATTLTSKTTVVLVPALVTSKGGDPVFTLKADDFTVTDDGVPQKLHLEEDSDSEPLALVVALENGGEGKKQIEKYRQLGPLIENLVGNVPHRIAVVTFAGLPKLVQDFTPETKGESEPFEEAVKNVSPAEGPDADGAAILDTLSYAVEILKDQPPRYRRAILLLSETLDRGSRVSLDQALRAVSDTNTTIYAMGFSTGRGEAGSEARHIMRNDTPGPTHGCMANPNAPAGPDDSDPNSPIKEGDAASTDANGSPTDVEAPGVPKRTGKQVAAQALDCAGVLLPPVALAKLAVQAAIGGFHRNVPETVAHLTGGEYYPFKNPKTIQRDLTEIANHVPNRYILSFQPTSPHPGLHALSVHLKDYAHLDIAARNSYWADTEPKP